MKIGTWNLAGRWNVGHRDLIAAADCDIWLLTEVNECVELEGMHSHLSTGLMAPGRRWAAVLSDRGFVPVTDPHPASAAVVVRGVTYCSSILPWRSCGSRAPWVGVSHADKTAAAVADLLAALLTPALWGAVIGTTPCAGRSTREAWVAGIICSP
jgi:hypothetical protein